MIQRLRSPSLPAAHRFSRLRRPWLPSGFTLWFGFRALASFSPQPDAATSFFDQTTIPTFKVTIPQAAQNRLRKTPGEYVHATLIAGGLTYRDVAIHLKGWGSFRELDDRPSLSIKFNKYLPHQRFLGLTKIMLNNSVQDPSLLGDYLSSRLFIDAGVPTPRTTHVQVNLDGRDLGVYVAAEAVNGPLLKRWFGRSDGNLYEGAIQDIDQFLDQDNGLDATHGDLRRLCTAARERDPAERVARLERCLDLDQFRNYLATDLMAGNWDGYALHRNNYRIYHDPGTDLMYFIPHGLDNSMHESRLSIMPPRRSILGSALLGTAAGRQRYRQVAQNLLSKIYRLNVLTNRVNEVTAKLALHAFSTGAAQQVVRRGADLCQRMVNRSQFLATDLAGLRSPPPIFDTAGIAKLGGWQPESDWVYSPLEKQSENGKETLYLNANNGDCNSSWRVEVYLPPGKYRFEGFVRSAQIQARGSQTGSGAGLRSLGNQRGVGLEGTRRWTAVSHSFAVEEDSGPIQLLCELRANFGEAWFDSGSLHLVRESSGNPP